MWFAPFTAIGDARKTGELGTLNPIPFFAIFFNCCGWTIYSIQTLDYYLFFSNITGIVISIYYCLSCMRLLSIAQQHDESKRLLLDRLELFFLFTVGFWLILSLVAGIILTSNSSQVSKGKIMIGLMSDIAVLSYYAVS